MTKRTGTPGADDILREELANGLILLARENESSRTAAISAFIPGGDMTNPRGKEGLSGLMASLLTSGTGTRDDQAISSFLETIGASIAFSSGMHGLSMRISCLAEDFDPVLSLAAEIVQAPSFPEAKFQQNRDQMTAALRYRAHDTGEMASLLFRKLYYGDHPYAVDGMGTVRTLTGLTRGDVETQFRSALRTAGTILAFSGGIPTERVLELVAAAFGSWNAAPTLSERTDPVAGAPSAAREHYEIPGMSQLNYVVGFAAPAILDPDYNALLLGNCVLGQFGMMGRIGNVVRDQNGLAYSISSALNPLPLGGTWLIQAGVNPDNFEKALELTLSEARRYLAEPVSAEELADVKSFQNGVLPLVLESNRGISSALLRIERCGLGLDYYREIGGKLAGIGAEEILDASRRYMKLDRAVIASAGTLERGA